VSTARRSASPPPNAPEPRRRFLLARHGYECSSVDGFVRDVQRLLERLQLDNAALVAENQRLNELCAELQAENERIRSTSPDDRMQDMLQTVAEQAKVVVADAERAAEEILHQARTRAAILDERGRQEFAWRRRQIRLEGADLSRRQQAIRHQLRSFQTLAIQAARPAPALTVPSYADVANADTETSGLGAAASASATAGAGVVWGG
jgi:cell division septum initiation protein DivIVA